MSLVNQRFTMNVAPIMRHKTNFYTLVGISDTSVKTPKRGTQIFAR
ncbi:hypothetical protein BSP239C_04078 [Brevibacterium sp. 239c]|nr:hypothetical protein BSP239C_04078 [Brevibacterium sp. 239c]